MNFDYFDYQADNSKKGIDSIEFNGEDRYRIICSDITDEDVWCEIWRLKRSTHIVRKQYRCLKCNKIFKTETALKLHSSIHSNRRPFVCSISGCNKTYKTRGRLMFHLSNH